MSKRPRKRKGPVVGTIGQPLEKRPVSDRAKLLWQDFHAPVLAAFNALQQALANAERCMVERIADVDGVDVSEGKWGLDVASMTWQRLK